jgi:hypothetical protein
MTPTREQTEENIMTLVRTRANAANQESLPEMSTHTSPDDTDVELEKINAKTDNVTVQELSTPSSSTATPLSENTVDAMPRSVSPLVPSTEEQRKDPK